MKNVFILLLIVCSGCATTIKRGSNLFKTNLSEAGTGIKDNIEFVKVNDNIKGKVKIDGDKVIVTPNGKINVTRVENNMVEFQGGIPMDGIRPTKEGVYYLLNDPYFKDISGKKLKYCETSIAVQGLAIAFKIRAGQMINGTTYPYQVESGSSFGIGTAYKLSYNTFSQDKNIWGSNLNSFSFTVGPFISLGTAGVKKSTNAPDLVGQDFTGLVWSPGIFFQFGYNSINLGYAVGADKLFGDASSAWIYDGILWNGVIVSINIAKF